MTAAKSSLPILDELSARGLVQDVMAPVDLGALLAQEQVSFYVGFDPTGTSLHAGSLVPITVMARLQRAGHKPFVLIGGATGMIGDPSGKSEERQLLGSDALEANIAGIRAQLARFLDFEQGSNAAVMVNNHDWFGAIGYLQFLRDVGKHVTVNYMMAKESVRARLEDRDQGISYTEFSYMLLQAYDFVVLARDHGCKLQVGGSDQWGNITAGVELYRKLYGGALYGFTAPLLMGQKGEKMGKTAAGTKLWLDPARTSPYAFYQHWLNLDDADVERMLKIFSWRSLEEIDAVVAEHGDTPQKRIGQRALAEDLTTFVHGEEATRGALAASRVMFGGALDDVRDVDLEPLLDDVPSTQLERERLEQGVELLELLATTGLAPSKGAARRLVKGGGVYVNNQRVGDAQKVIGVGDLGTETMIILRAGKKSYHIVRAR
ncbi:MAG: tyrosine--tRNA ligase [Deltaproteobacteria bacterium]|jgi:tyrosyl-tRNA synthetase|nr:tyrosine--tRNA ligase [Deltaproteobacteria bacterium]MBW2530987.1 tyrosine--tRNA ligase [Deltaproteobacteria bacterium]